MKRRIAELLVLLAIVATGVTLFGTGEPKSPLEGIWIMEVEESPPTFHFQPKGQVVLSQKEMEISGEYRLETTEKGPDRLHLQILGVDGPLCCEFVSEDRVKLWEEDRPDEEPVYLNRKSP